jgi:hypothetical protein
VDTAEELSGVAAESACVVAQAGTSGTRRDSERKIEKIDWVNEKGFTCRFPVHDCQPFNYS